ncbi:MAG: phage integrase N-terminal SAM-like domain-containing protein [Gammaproteobacteria bacterium]
MRATIRALHYSRSTEDAYCYWIRFYIRFHGCRHPAEMAAEHVSQFLTSLAVHRNLAATTQNQAFNAIVFATPATGTRTPSGSCYPYRRLYRPSAFMSSVWVPCSAMRPSSKT